MQSAQEGFFLTLLGPKVLFPALTPTYLCNVIRASQGESVACELISLGLKLTQFSLHDLFLGFIRRCAKADAIQLQQSQTVMGGHLHFRKYICSK